jgi:hypothetical protein
MVARHLHGTVRPAAQAVRAFVRRPLQGCDPGPSGSHNRPPSRVFLPFNYFSIIHLAVSCQHRYICATSGQLNFWRHLCWIRTLGPLTSAHCFKDEALRCNSLHPDFRLVIDVVSAHYKHDIFRLLTDHHDLLDFHAMLRGSLTASAA